MISGHAQNGKLSSRTDGKSTRTDPRHQKETMTNQIQLNSNPNEVFRSRRGGDVSLECKKGPSIISNSQ